MTEHENAKLDQILERLAGLKGRVHQISDTVCGPPGKPDQGLCWTVEKNGERIGTLCDKVDEMKAASELQQAESRAKARFLRKWGPWVAMAFLAAVAGGGSSEMLGRIIEAVANAQ